MNMSRVVKAGLVPGAAAAVIFLAISDLVGKLDGTVVIEGVVLGLVTCAVSLLIATLIAAAARRRGDPPAAGSR
jgi:hypothetical protein